MKVGNRITVITGGQWSFGNNVDHSINRHLKQSVLLHDKGHELIGFLSDFFMKNYSICSGIGSSTGTLIRNAYDCLIKDNWFA